MKNFRNLRVWQRAHQLVLDVYNTTNNFPSHERFGLTSQLRRSAVSVPANIAEGSGRSGDLDFARFLDFAFGSASELEYLLYLAKDLGLLAEGAGGNLLDEVIEIKRMLASLLLKLRAKSKPQLKAQS